MSLIKTSRQVLISLSESSVSQDKSCESGSISSTVESGSISSTAWMERGKCTGYSEYYFAPYAERPEARERRESHAKAICETCEVIAECREYARANRELGFWGGENEVERADAGFYPSTPVVGRSQTAKTQTAKTQTEPTETQPAGTQAQLTKTQPAGARISLVKHPAS